MQKKHLIRIEVIKLAPKEWVLKLGGHIKGSPEAIQKLEEAVKAALGKLVDSNEAQ